MPTIARPDYIGATIAFLRANSDLVTFVGADVTVGGKTYKKITGSPVSGAVMGTDGVRYVQVLGAGGSEGDIWVPHESPRVDVRCYGPSNHREAQLVTRLVQAIMVPPTRAVGFKYANCRVIDVREVLAPTPLFEPDTNWPFWTVGYMLRVLEVPVT